MDMPEELLKPSLISQRFRGFLPVVIDVETGGFNSGTDALLEVAAVILEMDSQGYLQIKDSFSRNIEPFSGAIVEQAALEFTGIDIYDPERNAWMREMLCGKSSNPFDEKSLKLVAPER